MASSRHVLTAVEFDALWEQLGLGPSPVALRLRSPGSAPAQRRALVAAGWPALRDRGLAGPTGPEPELARLMRLLAGPAAQLELRATWGHSVRAIAAGGPGAGVLAVRQDATVTLGGCGSLPAGLLSVLPHAGPGSGRACTVPTAALTAAALTTQTAPVARLLDAVTGRAQLVALATDRCGVARRAGGVVGVLDTAGGRYLLTRSVRADGVEWITVAPADPGRLLLRVARLLDEATSAAGASRGP